MLYIRRVVGESMLPTLRPNIIVVAVAYRRPRAGDIVIARHKDKELIKRVLEVQGSKVDVRGDNAGKSTDSRHFGMLPGSLVKGIVIWPRH